MKSNVSATIAQLRSAGLCPAGSTRGCPSRKILHLERMWGRRLPSSYRVFLQALGGEAGEFLSGSSFKCSEVESVNAGARELAAESNLTLPEDAFVFFMHQGYQFAFFILDGDDDPLVYAFEEGDAAFRPLGWSFSQWFAQAARDEIRINRRL
ncbi:MAG: SMI1/KNR4 family protein [Planctomycetota bacterium]